MIIFTIQRCISVHVATESSLFNAWEMGIGAKYLPFLGSASVLVAGDRT